jgi:hypothetical protein
MAAETKRVVVGLSVKLEVITQDKLRKFVFGVDKKQEGGLDKWTIEFELHDRTSPAVAFDKVIGLIAAVDLAKVPVAAVQATYDKGLDVAQVDYAVTTVAADAEKYKANGIKESRMKRTVAGLFAARAEA